MFVQPAAFAASVHGQAGVSCVDCHRDLAATTDFPHAEKLAPVDCASCHAEEAARYATSAHAEARRRNPASHGATCADCHGTHEILSPKDPASSTNHFRLPGTCLKCHGDPAIEPKLAQLVGNDPNHFRDSIHGRALEVAGLTVAPNCATCHRAHDIRPSSDEKSPVSRSRIPATCGSCHAAILAKYDAGVHGTGLKNGDPGVPVCSDCHTSHEVRQVDVMGWKLSVLKECGTCHEQALLTYRDTYHGQVTNLGFTRVATCADCHNAHDIFPKSDPRSTVSPAHRLATCRKCHANVGPNFVRYDPHANPRDRSRNPLLASVAWFMKTLLAVVFAFFGVHTALWLPRSVIERRKSRSQEPPP